jgi:hypothetical protein
MKASLLESIWRAEQSPNWSPRTWELVLSQARRARLSARLALHFREKGWMAQVTPGVRTALDNAWAEAQRKRDEVQWEVHRILQALHRVPTPIVLLKGAAYVLAELPPGQARQFSDVDILVVRAQLQAAELALFGAGWIAQKLDPYDERYYRDWMHELPPLQHVNRQTMLDVHHAITPPTSRFAVDSGLLLARLQPLPEHPGVSVLAPTDMVLHSVVHLMQDGDFTGALRDLLDLDGLLRNHGSDPLFWDELVNRASAMQLRTVLYYAWAEAVRLFNTPTPAKAAQALRDCAPGSLRRYIMHWLLVRAIRPDHPDCDTPTTKWARLGLYVRSHWLRMPPQQILPHLVRKAWMRSAARRQGANAKVRPQARIGL